MPRHAAPAVYPRPPRRRLRRVAAVGGGGEVAEEAASVHGRGGHRQGPPPPPPPPPPERRRRRRWRAAAAAAAAATAAARRQRLCAGAGYSRPTPAAARSETPSSPRSVAIRGARNRHIQIQMGGGAALVTIASVLDAGWTHKGGVQNLARRAAVQEHIRSSRLTESNCPPWPPAGMPWRNPLPGSPTKERNRTTREAPAEAEREDEPSPNELDSTAAPLPPSAA